MPNYTTRDIVDPDDRLDAAADAYERSSRYMADAMQWGIDNYSESAEFYTMLERIMAGEVLL